MPWEGNATLLKIFRHPCGPLADNDVDAVTPKWSPLNFVWLSTDLPI